MAKLKNLRLTYFGGYEDATFDFTQNDSPKSLALFFGPNGYGKSTVLEAIRLVSNPFLFEGRNLTPEVYLRKYVYDLDCDPSGDSVRTGPKNPMRVEANFDENGDNRKVVLSLQGFEINELSPLHHGHAYYLDADHPSHWAKFQMIADDAAKFIDLAETIFGHECDLDGEVYDVMTDELTGLPSRHLYYQDLIMTKGKVKVHYKSMSAGEKKLSTALRQLCTPDHLKCFSTGQNRDIILLDNIEMHVYMKRHAKMIDKLREVFANHQIIATTHSPILVGADGIKPHVDPMYLYDLEKIRGEL